MICDELLVLAGGFGMRLRSAVPELPKALAPVCGRPFLSYQIASWVGQGIRTINFLLFHQAELIEKFLGSAEVRETLHGCRVRTVVEPMPLGTGGSIANAIRQLDLRQDFLVTNADTWLGSGIIAMSEVVSPCMAVVEVADAFRFGRVKIAGSQIIGFEEKNAGGAGLINAGLYRLHPRQFLGRDAKPFSIERELFPQLVADGLLNATRLDADFIDIGVPSDYTRFCEWMGSGKVGVL